MGERVAGHPEADLRLVGLLRVHLYARPWPVGLRVGRRRPAGIARLDLGEELLELISHALREIAGNANDHARSAVPLPDVLLKSVARRRPDGLLAADDVPAERRVTPEELVIDTRDVVPRRVEVHVHLLDDDALLALDLLRIELRVLQHVDQDVEGVLSVLGGALDVVARVLLAREGVELGADAVELEPDLLRGRAPLGALEEHVLGE